MQIYGKWNKILYRKKKQFYANFKQKFKHVILTFEVKK